MLYLELVAREMKRGIVILWLTGIASHDFMCNQVSAFDIRAKHFTNAVDRLGSLIIMA